MHLTGLMRNNAVIDDDDSFRATSFKHNNLIHTPKIEFKSTRYKLAYFLRSNIFIGLLQVNRHAWFEKFCSSFEKHSVTFISEFFQWQTANGRSPWHSTRLEICCNIFNVLVFRHRFAVTPARRAECYIASKTRSVYIQPSTDRRRDGVALVCSPTACSNCIVNIVTKDGFDIHLDRLEDPPVPTAE